MLKLNRRQGTLPWVTAHAGLAAIRAALDEMEPDMADAIAAGDPDAAAAAMHEHVMLVSDVALLREQS